MGTVKGQLDLKNDYLKNMNIRHAGTGGDFLAFRADGASHAMGGKPVKCCVSKTEPNKNKNAKDTWAEKVKEQVIETKLFILKRKITKVLPPQGQSKEDRRLMIRLKQDYEARKTSSFELHQAIQKLRLC